MSERYDITFSNGEMILGEQAVKAIQEAKQLEQAAKELKAKADGIKAAVMEAMEEHGVTQFKNDNVTITYIEPTVKKVVDAERLKADGIYKYYLKDSTVKSSCRWTWAKEKKDGTGKK